VSNRYVGLFVMCISIVPTIYNFLIIWSLCHIECCICLKVVMWYIVNKISKMD
jgi:hypothetical protein